MRVIEAEMTEEATIYITEQDRQRLEKLIELSGQRDGMENYEYLRRLESELERAETVA
jgi:Rnk N-terminus